MYVCLHYILYWLFVCNEAFRKAACRPLALRGSFEKLPVLPWTLSFF